jgi:putative ABC transport system substrate-binding protein
VQTGGETVGIQFALEAKIPTLSCNKSGVEEGSLIGNVADFFDIAMVSAEKAALILEGAQPSWLRTEAPRDDFVIVNVETAQIIELSITEAVLNMARQIVGE